MIIMEIIKKRKNIVKDFIQYLKPYKKYFHFIVLLNLFVLAISVATPYLYKILLDDVFIRKEHGFLKWIILGYIVFFCTETILLLILRKINNYVYNDLMLNIRSDIWNKLNRIKFSDFEEFQHADLKQRIDSDVNCVETLVSQQIVDYVFLWLHMVVVGVLLLKMHFILGLASFIIIPIGNWISRLTGKGIWESSNAIRNIWGQYESYLQNSIQGWKDIKALSAEKRVLKRFTNFWHKFAQSFFKMQLYFLGNSSLLAVKDIILTKMGIYFVGAVFVLKGELTVGSLLVFGNYFNIFNDKLNGVIMADNQFNGIIPSIQRVNELISKGEKDQEQKQVVVPKDSNRAIGAIEFKNVSFKYKSSPDHVINQVNLKIDPGDCVAIVGRSGCGKSTLIKILLGLYEPSDGQVTITGQNIFHLGCTCLNNNIGVVMQDSMMFNLSVKENLLLARPTASEDEINKACKQAFADEFISKLPEGINTVIGERGSLLSGGQRQRLAIARALLKNPQIVVFDEATSALDNESEKMINMAIENISKNRTVIIIAHRLSSILLADKVVVIDKGRIEAIGKHNELYENCETYISLFKEQYSLNSMM